VRRSLDVDVDDLVLSLTTSAPTPQDDTTRRILDAAGELFAAHGVRRCTIDEIAERSGLGRTTVYRRFPSRSQIVTAVLSRECQRFFASILLATSHLGRSEEAVVEGFLTGLRSAESSLLSELVRSEPDVLRLLTVEAAPIIAVARDFLVSASGIDRPQDRRRAAVVAEMLVRLAISFVADDRSVIPLHDPEQSRRDLHDLLDPVLGPLVESRDHVSEPEGSG
jgi:AcrR family transcriptional regulator